MDEEAVPVVSTCNLLNNLTGEEIIAVIDENVNHLSNLPPVLPKEGQLFIYDLGDDKSLWESKKRKFR